MTMRPVLQTFTGREWNAANPSAYDYQIEEIAHALSNLCRFAGHTRGFYSVAQHSVLVASFVPCHLHKAALLHDAAEAFMVDMPAPIKRQPWMADYRAQSEAVECAIARHFGVESFERCDPRIREADMLALAVEKRDLLGLGQLEAEWAHLPGVPIGTRLLCGVPPLDAEQIFMRAWREMGPV